MTEPFDLLVHNVSEVLTLQGPSEAQGEAALSPIPRGAVGVSGQRIAYLGPDGQFPLDAVGPQTRRVDARGGFVGPGFVDPHTHLVYAGERSNEFELRCQGKGYLDIAQAGGGIMSTVRATRAATEDQLVKAGVRRLSKLLEQGITCAEVKSGYGLNAHDELKMLRAIRRLSALQPIELHATLLCAHAIPAEYKDRRSDYVRLCIDEIIPQAAAEKLARFFDVFVEQGAFDVEEAKTLCAAAASVGLLPRLHADQLTNQRGAQLAASVGAASADHLEQVSPEGIEALARAGVVAVLVPVASLYLKVRPYAPGRALVDAGVQVALGTNLNPGSAMTENHGLTLGLSCLENGLTAAEAYVAATRGGAQALRLPHQGRLTVGGPADLVVFSCASYTHLPYHLGINHARYVVKSGQVVADQPGLATCAV